MHTTEPLVSEPISFKDGIAIGKLKRYKSLGIDQIPAELIQTGGNILTKQQKESITVPIYKKGDNN
jgi:hypothetical protein